MKYSIVFIFSLMFALFGAVTAHAAEYWVEPGESISAAIGAAAAGDTVYLKAGTYEETINFSRGGTTDQWMTLRAETPGTVTIMFNDKIVFDHAYWNIEGIAFDHMNAVVDAFDISASNLVFDGIELFSGQRDGFDMNGTVNNITIKNSTIHDFVWQPGKDAHCIVLDAGASEVTILDSVIYDCGGDGIQLYASGNTAQAAASHNILIEGNSIYNTLASGHHENAIDIKNGSAVTIRNNVLYGFDHKIITLQKASYDVSIVGNILYGSDRGIEVRAEDGGVPTQVGIEHNVFYDLYGSYALKFDWVEDARVYHNTFYNVGNPIRVEEEGILSGAIYSNLAAASNKNRILGPLEANVGYNGWFDTDAEGLAASTDVTGGDPVFVNTAQKDFALQATSPAKNKAEDGYDMGAVPELIQSESTDTVATNAERAEQIARIEWAAAAVVSHNYASILSDINVNASSVREQASVSLLDAIGASASSQSDMMLAFIAYGTSDTVGLGAGERAGVLNSFQSVFQRLPASQQDWEDVMKIAVGRWPSQTASTASAEALFEQVYKRQASMENAHDAAAITIMTYGLRPSDRNLSSEAAASATFEAVFGHSPTSAQDWDVVRAIAYSGAVR